MATPEEEAAAKAIADKAAVEAAALRAKADPPEAKGLTPADRVALEAVVEKERLRAKDLEKQAKVAQAELAKLQGAALSDAEKLQKRAEEAEAKAGPAIEKVRRANVTLALADLGLQGARAKAAAKLLEDVEFDDDTDEPTNLDDRLTAAKAEYGEDMFKGARVPAPNVNGGEGSGEAGSKAPDLTADELAIAESFKMTPEEYQLYKDPSYSAPPKAAAS